jgi:hypothetical protein
MHMIRAHLHLINGDVILLSNVRKEFLYPLLHLTLQHITTVLRRPDEVILSIVDSMGCSSENHATILTPKLLWAAGIEPTAQSAHSPPPQVAGQPERFSRKGEAEEQGLVVDQDIRDQVSSQRRQYEHRPVAPRAVEQDSKGERVWQPKRGKADGCEGEPRAEFRRCDIAHGEQEHQRQP